MWRDIRRRRSDGGAGCETGPWTRPWRPKTAREVSGQGRPGSERAGSWRGEACGVCPTGCPQAGGPPCPARPLQAAIAPEPASRSSIMHKALSLPYGRSESSSSRCCGSCYRGDQSQTLTIIQFYYFPRPPAAPCPATLAPLPPSPFPTLSRARGLAHIFLTEEDTGPRLTFEAKMG